MIFGIPTPSFMKRSNSKQGLLNLGTPSTSASSRSSSNSGNFKGSKSSISTPPMSGSGRNIANGTPPPPLPKLNTTLASPTSSEKAAFGSGEFSPRKQRQLSERVRSAPSSLVRQLRSYSNSIHSMANGDVPDSPIRTSLKKFPSSNSITGQALLNSNRAVMDNLPAELSPVVTLINAQKLRTYAIGTFQVPGLDESHNRVWVEVEGKLTGNELAIWRPSEEEYQVETDEYKPKYINLTDSTWEWGTDEKFDLKISQGFNDSFLIKFNEPEDIFNWVGAICLSNFEYTSLNEAFTASILSLKGPKLSDIHILLSQKKRFQRSEWCNLRLSQISSKWLKVFVVTIPLENKKKKNGRIEIYLNDKPSKKNLILYVNRVDDLYNVYPEQPNMIDFNSIMKLDGEIYINKSFESLFVHDIPLSLPFNGSQLTHSSSMLGLLNLRSSSFAFKSHSRTGSASSLSSNTGHRNISVNSASSFFVNAPSPKQHENTSSISTSPKQATTSSLSSQFFKKEAFHFVSTDYLYLMPVHHPGVAPVETMIRNFIDIADSFKLYGRPDHFVSDKRETESMLFGLPSLPHYKYLSMSESVALVKENYLSSYQNMWSSYDWRCVFKNHIRSKQIKKSGYKGSGDILKLYKSLDHLEIDDHDYGISKILGASPRIQIPTNTSGLLDTLNDSVGAVGSSLSPNYELSHSVSTNGSIPGQTEGTPSSLGSPLGAPLEFEKSSRSPGPQGSEHPYYSFMNNNSEYESLNPSPFVSSPLRPKV